MVLYKENPFHGESLLKNRLFEWLAVLLMAVVVSGCVEGGSSGEGGTGGSPAPAISGWEVTLTLSVSDPAADGGVAYNRLVAVRNSAATDKFDSSFDIRAFLAGPLQAYFAHIGDSGYDAHSQELWQDHRSKELPQEWPIEVWAESGRIVTVTWSVPEEGEVSCALYPVRY